MTEYLSRVDVGDLDDVYYVDLDMYGTPHYGAAYVVDAEIPAIVETGMGTNRDRILDALDALDIDRADVGVVSPTHVHLDHAGGAGYLAEACPNATVLTYEAGVKFLLDPGPLVEGTKEAVGDQWAYYADPVPVPEDRIKGLADGDVIDLGDHQLSVHHAPGHAFHQAVYLDEATGALFAADAAGIYTPDADRVLPTTPPPGFGLEGALADVDRIRDLAPSVLLYTHFGPNADVEATLDAYETVLRDWVAEVEALRADLGSDEAVLEHLAANPEMSDVWGDEKASAEMRLNASGVLAYLNRREE